jgi:hypothetical protein
MPSTCSWVLSRDLLQAVLVGDAVDEGHDDVQAGRQRGVVLAEPLDHPGVLLGHDVDGLEDEHQGDDEDDERDGTEGQFHEHPL